MNASCQYNTNSLVIYIFSHIKPKFLSNKLVFSTENVEKSGFWDARIFSHHPQAKLWVVGPKPVFQ